MAQSETVRLGLPMLQPAQAQKHVTVNEALMRLDGLVNLVLQSVTRSAPPASVVDGECWGVPGQAQGEWAGNAGRIAIGTNGGWTFCQTEPGISAFVIDQGVQARHNGGGWVLGAINLTSLGSGLLSGVADGEVDVIAGPSFDTGIVIPSGAMVIGAVARVTSALTGTLTGWRLGTAGAVDRFGSSLGTGIGSWSRGILGTPTTYYQPQPLLMTAEGGAFAGGGKVRLAVHWWELRLPNA